MEYTTAVMIDASIDGDAAVATWGTPSSKEMANAISAMNFFMKLYLGC